MSSFFPLSPPAHSFFIGPTVINIHSGDCCEPLWWWWARRGKHLTPSFPLPSLSLLPHPSLPFPPLTSSFLFSPGSSSSLNASFLQVPLSLPLSLLPFLLFLLFSSPPSFSLPLPPPFPAPPSPPRYHIVCGNPLHHELPLPRRLCGKPPPGTSRVGNGEVERREGKRTSVGHCVTRARMPRGFIHCAGLRLLHCFNRTSQRWRHPSAGRPQSTRCVRPGRGRSSKSRRTSRSRRRWQL